jgi:hypothetical protein
MGTKGITIAAALAAAAFSGAAAAHTSVSVQIGSPIYTAPAPVVVYQPVRAERAWVNGHWEWQGNGHVWVPGRYRPVHGTYAYRDRDRDGVPDRFDRAPYNPYRN